MKDEQTVQIWLTPEAVEKIKLKKGWVLVATTYNKKKTIQYVDGEKVSTIDTLDTKEKVEGDLKL